MNNDSGELKVSGELEYSNLEFKVQNLELLLDML